MPAYNEEENISSVVRQWHSVVERLRASGFDASLVVANDGSKDSTSSRMHALAGQYPFFEPVDKANSGHGATLLFLYHRAISAGADFIFQTDSDGQTEPEEFWQMWEDRNDFDLQVGMRNNRRDGLSRIVVSKVLKGVVRLTFGVKVPDANTPFRLMNVKAIIPVLEKIPTDFFLSNVALAAIAVKFGLRTRWLPVSFRPRQGGVNSINLPRIFKIGCKAVGDLYRMSRSLG